MGWQTIHQGLIRWLGTPSEVTWEDLADLHTCFPAAPAWGQADSQGEGIVSSPATDGGERMEDRGTVEESPTHLPFQDGNWSTSAITGQTGPCNCQLRVARSEGSVCHI